VTVGWATPITGRASNSHVQTGSKRRSNALRMATLDDLSVLHARLSGQCFPGVHDFTLADGPE
jgi:hypothetical protein